MRPVIQGGGDTSTPLSAVAIEDIEARLTTYSEVQGGPVYNVKDGTYGAVGSGLVNDQPAIQAAIDDCPAGGKVLLPPGIYRIDSTLTISKTITLEGVGAARTANDNSDPAGVGAQINYNANTGDAILIQPTADRIYPQLRNFLIVGNRNKGGASSGGGIHLNATGTDAVNDFVLDCCHVSEAYDDGLLMTDNVYEGRISSCMFDDNGRSGVRGQLVEAAVGANEIRMFDVHANDNVENGYDLSGGGTFQMFGITGSRNVKAVYANGVHIGLYGLQAESNTGDAVEFYNVLHGIASHIRVDYPEGATGHGIRVNGASRSVVIGPACFLGSTTGDDISIADTASETMVLPFYPSGSGVNLGSGENNVYFNGGEITGGMQVSGGDMYVDTDLGTYKLVLGDSTSIFQLGPNTIQTYDKFVASGGLGVGNSAAATTLGTVTDKIEIFDDNGASIGYLPVYDAIT